MPIVVETLEDHLRWQFGSLILQVLKSAKRVEDLEAQVAQLTAQAIAAQASTPTPNARRPRRKTRSGT